MKKISECFFFLYENFQFLEVKFSIYLKRRVFVMEAYSILIHVKFEGYSIYY